MMYKNQSKIMNQEKTNTRRQAEQQCTRKGK